MPLQRFIPSSSDRYISNDKNQGAVKFGHLNAVVDYINENGGGAPAGAIGEVQFNGGGVLAADPGLFWDNTNKRFFVSGTVVNAAFYNTGQTYDPTNPARDFVFGSRTLRVAGNGLFIDNFDGASNTALSFGEGQATKMSFYYQPVDGNPGLTMRNNYAGNTMMRWNRANNYVSINNYTSPAQLYIKSSGSTSATTSLLVQNSSGTDLLKVDDSNTVTFNNSILQLVNVVSSTTTLRLDSQGTLGVIRMQGNQIGMGNNTTGDASALLTLTATTKGFLPPRMTTTQKNAISTPAAGLMVYDNTLNQLSYFNGTSWVNV